MAASEFSLHPLTRNQFEIYVEQLLEPASPIFNIGAAISIAGPFDAEAFCRALRHVYSTHPEMHSRIVEESGSVFQRIQSRQDFEPVVIDLSGEADPGLAASVFMHGEDRTPFDLSSDSPLTKHVILRIAADRWISYSRYHHIVFDGWATSIFHKKVIHEYNRLKGAPDPEGIDYVPFTEFLESERQYLASAAYERDRQYWTDRLTPPPAPCFERKFPFSTSAAREVFRISRPQFEQLSAVGRAHDGSGLHFLIAVLFTYVFRTRGCDDLSIMLPTLNRRGAAFKRMLGLCVNTTPLRVSLDAGRSFGYLIAQIAAQLKKDYRHQRCAIADLFRTRSGGETTEHAVQLFLSYEIHDYSTEFFGCNSETRPIHNGHQARPLQIYVREYGPQADVVVDVDYNRLYFDRADVERMIGHIRQLIESAIESPEASIAALPYMSDGELRRVLVEFNETACDDDRTETVVSLFERQAAETPDGIAVVFEERQLTFAELNAEADRVAAGLITEFAIKPDDCVAICMERSERLIVAMLGVLKAGAAYVPIDPEYPQERIDFILKDTNASTLLQRVETGTNVRNYKDTKIQGATSNHLAYVIYTSGSTGQPKGVMVEHGSLANSLLFVRDKIFRHRRPMQAGLLASPTFDASVEQIFANLIHGNTVHIASARVARDPALVLALLRHRQIEVVGCTPSLFAALLDVGLDCDVLEWFIGGEALPSELLTRYFGAANRRDVQITNFYGPTECTINTTAWCTDRTRFKGDGPIPIGRPVDNYRIYILDKQSQPMPIGVAGEICVGGIGVARGYLNRPELTAEKFVPNPFKPGERMYRTGDRGRWLEDGTIEYLGRIDDQVKIRGYRIEPGEIEHCLRNHPKVKACAVVAHDIGPNKELVAYVASDSMWNAAELRAHLKASLPDYMIPAYWIAIDELPMSSSEKLDRRALPPPEQAAVAAQIYVAPRTAIERQMCRIWETVLALDRIGIDDNFFDIGGHSLKATQIVSRMSKELEAGIGLRDVFENLTIRKLAGLVETRERQSWSTIEPVPEADDYALSHAQKRLWILEQFDPDARAYIIARALRLQGPLDFERVRQALNAIVQRHESLRTTIRVRDGNPRQVVQAAGIMQFELQVSDSAAVLELLEEDARRSFDLVRGPLMRCRLIRLSAEDHIVSFQIHHIVSDAWSVNVLVKEFLAEHTLSPLRIQYKDYAAWQNQLLQDGALDSHRSYWHRKLGGELQPLQLPLDHDRSWVQTFNGSQYRFEVPGVIQQRLRQQAQQSRASLFMMLAALVKALLFRYTRQNDICIGTPVAGRTHVDLEEQIGFYVNTLVLRDDVRSEDTFEELLHKVRKTAEEAYEHQAYPFDLLVEELEVERDLARSPLFDVMVVHQGPIETPLNIPGTRVSDVELESVTSKFDLTFSFEERDAALAVGIEYNTDLFEKARIERMGRHLERLIAAVLADPRRPIGDLEIVPPDERQRLLVEFNDTFRESDRTQSIVSVFERQAGLTPDAVAVIYEDRKITYGELNVRADGLAGSLVGECVAICMPRSEDVIVAMLAILKAGGAYVPIDPDYPKERIEFILRDTNASTLLQRVEPVTDGRNHKDTKIQGVTSGNLAYVMYTSGSTGQPKGVMVEHRAVLRLVVNPDYIELSPATRILQTGSLAFDASTFEIWGALLNGGTLVLAPETSILEPGRLKALVRQHAITTMWLTSSLFNEIVDANIGVFDGLRELLIGGEKLSSEHVNRVKRSFPSLVLINGYGPTENTTFTACHRIETGPTLNDGDIPIGKPIANTQVIILDERNHLAPVGVPGEICAAGDGLARGYVNDLELTERKFVPHPYKTGERIYRTGDLGRWRDDGVIEYLGRIDDQVKIRGYRIEPAEIEHRLRAFSNVKACAVVAREVRGTNELVAYVVNDAGAAFDPAELRTHLKAALPAHMIPAYWVSLDEIPLTSSGKLDRQALPAPDPAAVIGGRYVAPRTETERQISRIWCAVLGLDRISIDDHFFDIGGHSLKATQIVSRMAQELERSIGLRDMFERPTIRRLAQFVDTRQRQAWTAIQPVEEAADYALSHPQKRLWILEQIDPDARAYIISKAFRLDGPIDADRIESALRKIVDRHEVLRTTIEIAVNREPRQKVHATGAGMPWSMERVDVSRDVDPQARAMECVEDDTRRRFDLARGPLVRCRLIKLAADRHIVSFQMHHITSDGWSMNVFVQEFLANYESEDSALPPLRIQYKDYAAWQNRLLEDNAIEPHRQYWHEKLGGEVERLQIPADRERPAMQTFNGSQYRFELSAATRQQLEQQARRHEASLFMMLVALLKVLLHRYTSQRDISIGTPLAGRTHVDLEDQIGFYVNTLVLRDEIRPDESFKELLSQVKHTAEQAHEHEIYPFDRLVEELKLDRDLGRSPLFDVMAGYQNQPATPVELEGVRLSVIETHTLTSKFDMTVGFEDVEDRLGVSIEYNTDLFDRARIERMARHFEQLIASVLADETTPIRRLDILPATEKHGLLEGFNATDIDYDRTQTFVTLFERQAEQTPDCVAVVFEDRRLTYAQLNSQANRLAHHLAARFGLEPDDRVAICMDRSEHMIVALIAVLKAGAAYVPLDPDYPQERIAFIVKDTAARTLLIDAGKLFDLEGLECELIAVDVELPLLETPGTNPARHADPSDLAYVIYTSGSTGQPKGVMIEHHSLANLCVGTIRRIYAGYESPIKEAVVAPLVFDASVFQIFPNLVRGNTLHIVPESARRDPAQLLKYLADHSVEILNVTPSLFAALLDAGLGQRPEGPGLSVREWTLAGEALAPGLVERFWSQEANRRVRLKNLYGPTECCVDATIYPIDPLAPRNSIIGTPADNTQIYIVDEDGQPMPLGTAGELCIGGAGVGRGYLNRPELTAEKFVANPFRPDERMYRTGDRARWLAGGNIEYLGRMDDQVKIRGYRIEPGEIEHRLRTHSKVKACAVVPQQIAGDRELVAYIAGNEAWDAAELRGHLKRSLPEHMIPAYWMAVEEIPLTPSGKLDRRALPLPDQATVASKSYAQPRTETERRTCRIWETVLGLARVGIDDDFFEIGGHSLKATQVVLRMAQELNADVGLRDVFEKPTIRQLCELVDSRRRTPWLAIEPVTTAGHYALSHAQRRLWILEQADPHSGAYIIPAAFTLRGPLDAGRFQSALQKLVERHEVLRTTFVVIDGEPRQQVREPHDVDIAAEDGRLDLTHGPMLRCSLIELGADDHILRFQIHHIASDGWSMNVLVKDLLHYYETPTQTLPPLRIQYKDYAAWQNRLLETGIADADRRYWLAKLSGNIEPLQLPLDRPRPAIQTLNGSRYEFQIPSSIRQRFEERRRQSSLFMMLVALVNTLLYRYTGQTDICIGTPVSGRAHLELENQIGFYVNTLVLRNEIRAEDTFDEFLEKVRQTTSDAFEHQFYPFDRLLEDLVDDLNVERDPSRAPLFDVLLVYESEPVAFAIPGVVVQPMPVETGISKFDLTFSFAQSGGELSVSITYNTDLFDRDRIERMGRHLEQLMMSVVANETTPIKRLRMIPEGERQRVVAEFNAAAACNHDRTETVVSLFEKQVEATPDRTALVFEDRRLSFRDLNTRANRLANDLIARFNIEPDDRVAVLMERSERCVVAMLGILKAGAAYVPIDPDYPQERIDFILKDTAARTVLRAEDVPDFSSDLAPGPNPARRAGPQHLAYVIYTSGSTGQPKGVMIEHHSVVNLVHGFVDQIYGPLEAPQHAAVIAVFTFDASVKQTFVSLTHGHTLHVVPTHTRRDGFELVEWLARNKITTLDLTPSLYSMMLDAGLSRRSDIVVERWIIGGEALPPALLEASHTGTIFNVYGPTEASVNCTAYRTQPGRDEVGSSVPIGRPLNNAQIYILDDERQPSPIGVFGEIWIGGEGIARGYLNRPDLTAEKFVEGMYRTGDRGRWRPGGTIEYAGRIDDQIKIRGYRIEPGEIEHLLRAHPKVKACAVVASEIRPAKELVAYVASDSEWNAAELRSHLKESLPDYMVPNYWMPVAEIPLASSGKVNRHALPAPDHASVAAQTFSAPRTEIEKQMCRIWETVLGVDRVGIDDHFFDIGGHSLKATQIVSRMARELNADVGLRDVFEKPTIRQLAGRIEGVARRPWQAIERVEKANHYALSHAQKRLWILEQIDPDARAYIVPAALRVDGPLDVERLEQALRKIVERHEVLRTTIDVVDGEPRQRVREPGDSNFAIQVSDSDEIALEEDARQRFDLANGPVVRCRLIKLGDESHILSFQIHHIASDGWSLRVLMKEFLDNYESPERRLPPLRIQYKDYAAWQNRLLESEEALAHRRYWHDKLAGEMEPLQLPLDHERPALQTFNGSHYQFEIPSDIAERAKHFQTSAFVILVAVVKILLCRYTGQSDIRVGTPVAGRTHVDLEDQIGFYVNTLVLRDDVRLGETFEELLGKVKQTAAKAFEHQMYPFDLLVEELRVERDLARSPLFDVLVLYDAEPEIPGVISGMQILPLQTETIASKFDLTISFTEGEGALTASIEYNTDLFERPRIERMGRHLGQLIASALAEPKEPIGMLRMMPEDEERRLLVEFNPTAGNRDTTQSVVTLFERQVDETPDAVAVVFEDREITYRELNARADDWAHVLIAEHGIGPDDRVAICMPRSERLIVAIFGILKAGGAYVPIDPDYPQERIEFILKDTNARTLLRGVEPVTDGSNHEDTKTQGARSNHLAYVLYTSGSTGRPKGVMIEHRSLTAFALCVSETFRLKRGARIYAVTPPTFDISILELVCSLACGISVVVAGAAAMRDPQQFVAEILDRRVTVLQMTPSRLQWLVEACGTQFLEHVSTLILGGEPIPHSLYEQLKSIKSLTAFNGYGPTETTIYSTAQLLGDLNIGRPLPKDRIYILDEELRLVPIGIPGEICIGGEGVARGYLNQPELTAEKFVSNLYRTGDRGRWRADGTIEYLGRIDDQVKIRGYRIEPGEIEHRLRAHSKVKACAIVSQQIAGNKELVAYVAGNEPWDAAELRAHLKQTLPDYMIPAYWQSIDDVPLTSSGKVNRRALPAVNGVGIVRMAARTYAEPRTTIEKQMCRIWESVLGRDRIGIDDHFFDIGGHSLRATQIVSRMARELDADVGLRDVFEKPTIRELAERIEGRARRPWQEIERVAEASHYALSHAQKRLWILEQIDADARAYIIPMAVRIEGPLDVDRVERALRKIIERHEVLRTTIELVDGQPRQKVHEPGDSDFAMQVSARALERFDLAHGPVFCCRLIKAGDELHILSFQIHHIASDGWSMNVLVKEFLHYYESPERSLPPLRIQYKDYAAWQNRLLATSAIEPHREYWHEKLAGILEPLDLALDHVRPAAQTFNGSRHRFQLSTTATQQLEQESRRHHASLFMMLAALVKVLLHRYTGQTDIRVGTPVAGRTHVDLEDQIGFYVNTLVLRDDVRPEDTFEGLLEKVKRTATEAYEHQMYPFDRLVDELRVERDLARAPLFDVLVEFQNQPHAEFVIRDVRLRPIEIERGTSNFDLRWTFAMEPDGSLLCAIEYNTDLFEAPRIARMGRHLERLVESACSGPERMIGRLNLMPDEERQQLLVKFNDTAREREATLQTVVSRFEKQAEETPDRIAVVFEDRQWTYRHLNAQANRLAHELIARYGVAPNDCIGICMDRSDDLIIAILGVLKAGAAFVPVDRDDPSDRTRFILDDTRAKALLIDAGRLFDFEGLEIELMAVDAELPALTTPTTNPQQSPVSAADLAYVIYTSGSTGRPKGVLVEQRQLAHYLNWATQDYPFQSGRFGLHSPLTFDLTITSVFCPLLRGECLYVYPPDWSVDQSLIYSFDEETPVDSIKITPSHIELLRKLPIERTNITTAIVGGEALTLEQVQTLHRLNPDMRVFNEYGPTETTVGCVVQEILPADRRIFIGRPIANTRISIVDERLELMPIGTAGEICVSGDGVARGYLHQPELTAEKFVSNPNSPGDRMYRTGDRGRWLEDGTIEYLGRVDDQIKIRGYRIEPAEIEHCLRAHPNVKECAVVARNIAGAKELVAYVVSGEAWDASGLRAHLKAGLPEYMIPSHWVEIAEIPLTANGKLDRRALPSPDAASVAARSYVAPRTGVEERLCEIWKQALALDRVGIEDHFFDIGGNSLKAVHVMARIHEEFAIDLSLLTLFQTPTVRGLSEHLDEILRFDGMWAHGAWGDRPENQGVVPTTFRPVGPTLIKCGPVLLNESRRRKIFALPPPPGYAGVYKPLAERLTDHSLYGLDFVDSPDLFDQWMHKLRELQPEEGYVLMGYSAGGLLAFEVARRLEAAGKRVANLIFLDSFRAKLRAPENGHRPVEMLLEGTRHYAAHHPDFQVLFDNLHVRNRILRDAEAYLRCLDDLDLSGRVSASIHLVQSTDPAEDSIVQRWKEATDDLFEIHRGEGSHLEMLFEKHVAKNAHLIETILAQRARRVSTP